MALGPLKWANSRSVGGVTEVAVLAPIRKGRVPGERRTYEERARTLIATIESRALQGVPTELDPVTTIHFGEIIVIRPEQYLTYSNVNGVSYAPDPDGAVPLEIDDYQPTAGAPEFRTFLLTIVFFDGELKPYFKDISVFTTTKFDQVFENCEDYPRGGCEDFEGFWSWIRRYQVPVDLFVCRYPNLSAVRIRQLEEFKRRFDAFVTRVRGPGRDRPHNIDDLFDVFLRENEEYAQNFPSSWRRFRTPKKLTEQLWRMSSLRSGMGQRRIAKPLRSTGLLAITSRRIWDAPRSSRTVGRGTGRSFSSFEFSRRRSSTRAPSATPSRPRSSPPGSTSRHFRGTAGGGAAVARARMTEPRRRPPARRFAHFCWPPSIAISKRSSGSSPRRTQRPAKPAA